MAFNHTLSAILRGQWLISETWADAHLPVVMSFMKGQSVDFGIKEDAKDLNPTKVFQLSSANAGAASAGVYKVRPQSDTRGLPEGSIALITLSGPMLKHGDMCSYGMIDQAQLITRLGNDRNIGGIILDIDSPGGQADGTAMLSDAIKNVSAKKPVISFINDGMAASAAMWIASAANETYVSQATDQVGSIGVYTKIVDWTSFYKDAMKMNVQDIYAPQSTDKNKDYRDAVAGDTSAIEQDLSVLADQFINTISANRAGKVKGDTWKTGKMFYAKEAQKIGLIDGIKSFDKVLTRMSELIASKSPQNKKSSNMAFTKTISAAKATEFAVVEGGFLLEEDQLNNIETALSQSEASAEAVATAVAENTALQVTIASLQEAAATSETVNSAQAARIVELEAEVKELGKKPSGTGTALQVDKDPSTEEADVPAYLSDADPANAWFDKQTRYMPKPAPAGV